jgi:hypothetical protein
VGAARSALGIPPSRAIAIVWDEVELAERSEEDIAAELNVSVSKVARERAERGLPKPPPDPRGHTIHWTKAGLGKRLDAEVAAALNLPPAAVTRERIRHPFSHRPAEPS